MLLKSRKLLLNVLYYNEQRIKWNFIMFVTKSYVVSMNNLISFKSVL